jgi:uncharacterized protein YjbI with pentapeptide repeats
MGGLLRRFGFSSAIALLLAWAPPGALAQPQGVKDGSRIAERLRSNTAVVESELVVRGPLDLSGTDLAGRVFRCRGCTFEGPVSAPDVRFARTVDLSGSTFKDDVNFRGATFEAPALFGAAVVETKANRVRRTAFRARADFSLAVFEESTSFGSAVFSDSADFDDARFLDATFATARFAAGATFARASFRGAVLFYRTIFGRSAAFEESDFRRRTDFSRASFRDGGVFTRAQFAEGALFLGTRFFVGSGSAAAGRFQSVASGGDLNFTFATFKRLGKPSNEESGNVAVFSELVCARTVRLRDVEFAGLIAMNELQVRDLVMDVPDVRRVDDRDDQRIVLQTIEESAKARGDLVAANDAHYALRVLRQQDFSPLGRALDYVFYRGVAGYFVRPARPLLVLALLATMMALIRAIRSSSNPPQAPRRGPRRQRMWRAARRHSGEFVTSLLNTFSLVGPRWGGSDRAAPSLGLRVEVFAYRLLLVCVLLGLANSNPTLREMVDTLF